MSADNTGGRISEYSWAFVSPTDYEVKVTLWAQGVQGKKGYIATTHRAVHRERERERESADCLQHPGLGEYSISLPYPLSIISPEHILVTHRRYTVERVLAYMLYFREILKQAPN